MVDKEYVILVDENDHPIGEMEKLAAHHSGQLHRAFSLLLYNDKGEILLQQRALTKYHSGGLWTNTCCSHQRPQERTPDAIARRVEEELWISSATLSHLQFIGSFIYQISFDNGLSEHELDHVYIASYNGIPNINPKEAIAYRWISFEKVKNELNANPEQYTFWFKEIISQFCTIIEDRINESL